MVKALHATAIAVALAVAAVPAAHAATRTWQGDVSTSWNVAGNWAENAIPANGDDLVFPDNPTSRDSNNDIAGLSIASVAVTTTNSGADYNFTGNAITLTGPVTFSNPGSGSSGRPNWSIPLTLGAPIGAPITVTSDGRVSNVAAAIGLGPNTLTVAGNGDLVLSGAVSGKAGIDKNSAGSLRLAGSNTYGGPTAVNAGTLYAASATALGSNATGTTFANGTNLGLAGGPFTLTEPLTFVGPVNGIYAYENVTLAGGIAFSGTLTYSAFGPGSISGAGVSGSGTFVKSGVDTLSTVGTWPAFTGQFNVVAGAFSPTSTTFPAAVNLQAPAALYGYGATGLLTITGGTFAPGIGSSQFFRPAGLASSGGQHNLNLAPGTGGTDYDQIQVTGPVALGGTTLVVTSVGPLPLGGVYTIIDNDGADAVAGTYAGYAEGAAFQQGSNWFRIGYAGGSGNDVVLTVIAEPAPPPAGPAAPVPGPGPVALVLGTLALLLATRRRLH